ncbi:MAG: DUF3095 domain-containing protein [Chloroflexota bacterium]
MEQTTTFFSGIPPMHNIRQIVEPEHYYDVPPDWLIAMTDVRGSTEALAAGRYKDVNAIAAASITALLNIMAGVDVPFVFGGDGAAILIPPDVATAAHDALIATRRMAAEQFDLDLRAGIVPVADVLRDGYRVQVARLEMSPNFSQGIFSGGGLSHAEYLLKDPQTNPRYAVDDSMPGTADFFGLECRWNTIPSTHEETVSLMIMALPEDSDTRSAIYRDVLAQLEAIYGDQATRHPIVPGNLRLSFRPSVLNVEARIRHAERGPRRLLKMMWGTFKAWMAMRFGIGQWGTYRHILTEATDHEKFDDTLRMTISGTITRRDQLRTYLEAERAAGRLVYGIATSPFTLVTCIVFDYFGRQMHLVDGAGGGYTLAAREMKAQLARRGEGRA